MLIDSQITKQWLDEWLEDQRITTPDKYSIKVQIRTYVQDKISITIAYGSEVINLSEQEPFLLERSTTGIKRTVVKWLENSKEDIFYHQKWTDFVRGLKHIDEFREKNSPA